MTDINALLDDEAPATKAASKSSTKSNVNSLDNETKAIIGVFEEILLARVEIESIQDRVKKMKKVLSDEHKIAKKVVNGTIKLLEAEDAAEYTDTYREIERLFKRVRRL